MKQAELPIRRGEDRTKRNKAWEDPRLVKSPGDNLLSRGSQYHRRSLLDDRVRNGNGYGQTPIITGNTKGGCQMAPTIVVRKVNCFEHEFEIESRKRLLVTYSCTSAGGREKGGQADRPISTGKLNMLPCLHRRPINLVVSQGAGRDD